MRQWGTQLIKSTKMKKFKKEIMNKKSYCTMKILKFNTYKVSMQIKSYLGTKTSL